MTLVLPAPAKLNLFLHIIGQRSDGYHNLQTVFQFIDLCDEISFETTETPSIEILNRLSEIPDTENLIYQSALLLQNHCHSPQGVKIRLKKHIPIGGGLGGGSSDAATTLLALNYLWNTGLNQKELMNLSVQLGADVPVFISGKAAWGEGIGEKLTPLEPPESWYLLLKPACHVDTGKVFRHKDLTRNSPPITIATFLAQGGQNDCQKLVRKLYPEVDNALKLLENFKDARMTGTGACVFCSFPDESSALAAQGEISKTGKIKSFVVKGLNTSPLNSALARAGITPLPGQ